MWRQWEVDSTGVVGVTAVRPTPDRGLGGYYWAETPVRGYMGEYAGTLPDGYIR